MPRTTPTAGFSLLEMSLVLLIFGLLASGLLASLAASTAAQKQHAAEQQLSDLVDAILGFAVVHGRLPCPANPALPEGDSGAGLEECTRSHGVVPWVTLSASQTDPWGRRLTYFASDRFTGPPLSPGGAAFALDTAGNGNVYDPAGKTLATGLPLLVVSHGPNGTGGYLPDGKRFATATSHEAENADADLTFVQSPPGSLNNDDILLWRSAEMLKGRLLSAGRLP